MCRCGDCVANVLHTERISGETEQGCCDLWCCKDVLFSWGEKHGYLQMRKRCQVAEGAFGNTGNVIAVERSEAEAQVRGLTPSNGSELRTLPGSPRLAQSPLGFPQSPTASSSRCHLLCGRCVNVSLLGTAGRWGVVRLGKKKMDF